MKSNGKAMAAPEVTSADPTGPDWKAASDLARGQRDQLSRHANDLAIDLTLAERKIVDLEKKVVELEARIVAMLPKDDAPTERAATG